MGNKKVLSKATRELNKTKRFAVPKNIIEDPRGQWAHPGEITRIPSDTITMQGVPYPVMAYPNMGEPQMMYPGQEYYFPGADYVDEYPQMKRGGTPKSLVKMPKPSKKGLASKKFSRSLEATNRLFTEHPLFAKPKSKRRKVFDPNAVYQDGGLMTQEEIDGATEGMMKARLAYAYMHGNPAAQRMVVAPDQPYVFDHGDTGTHFMASMDDYAVPLIQDINGQLMLGDFGPESAEAIRFDNPEDAMYFSEHYKEITPDESYRREEEYQEGGMTTPLDLDPKTMKKYKEFLKVQENSIKAGYNASQDKWYPHTSPEGGKKTIAYGHKLQGSDASKYAKGITTAQANELLNRDILKHQAIAEAEVDSKYGKGTFDSLPQQSQMLLVDYAYNLGTLNEFPKFVNGVVTGNKQQMLAEHTRYFNGDQPLEQRNAWVVDTIQGKNSQSSTPTALKKTPVSSTTKKQSSDGTRDQWGRSQATIWYGFNPKTKQYDQDGLIWEQYGDPGPGIEGPGKGAYVTPGERLRLYEEGLKKNKYSDGGIVLELSDSEIEEYRKGGWIVEEM